MNFSSSKAGLPGAAPQLDQESICKRRSSPTSVWSDSDQQQPRFELKHADSFLLIPSWSITVSIPLSTAAGTSTGWKPVRFSGEWFYQTQLLQKAAALPGAMKPISKKRLFCLGDNWNILTKCWSHLSDQV